MLREFAKLREGEKIGRESRCHGDGNRGRGGSPSCVRCAGLAVLVGGDGVASGGGGGGTKLLVQKC